MLPSPPAGATWSNAPPVAATGDGLALGLGDGSAGTSGWVGTIDVAVAGTGVGGTGVGGVVGAVVGVSVTAADSVACAMAVPVWMAWTLAATAGPTVAARFGVGAVVADGDGTGVDVAGTGVGVVGGPPAWGWRLNRNTIATTATINTIAPPTSQAAWLGGPPGWVAGGMSVGPDVDGGSGSSGGRG